MKPDIIADENISRTIIAALRDNDYSVLSIKERFIGLPDSKIIEMANELDSLIITEDSDFGEWIFHYGVKSRGVLYQRYNYIDRDNVIKNLINVLQNHGKKLLSKFTVISVSKIRIRDF